MCGINIIISTSNTPINGALHAMQKANQFRGPDASGLFVHTNNKWQIGVGVNRLQVVDNDKNSDQPMVSANGNYVLAYNGEVYNYHELKNQLINKGHVFKTNSDTEVVLYWLQEYGTEGMSAFKGMFALVFVDLVNEVTIIARDRHGIKPLFYYQTEAILIISSSIQAIESTEQANLKLNPKAINDYLSYRHVMGNYTFYQEIHSLEPGTLRTYDNKLTSTNSLIRLPAIEEGRSLNAILVDTTSLLIEASSTPGLMLSGGVDSTLLLAILQQELGINGVNTYTLGAGADKLWAKKASVQYGSSHREIAVSIDSLLQLDDFLKHTDQPIADHGAFATWLVAKVAAQDSNTLLSGAGADELFAGYNRHRAFNYYLNNQQQAIFFQNVVMKSGLKRLLPKVVTQVLGSVDESPILTYQNFLQNHGINKRTGLVNLWQTPKSLTENLIYALEFDRRNYLVADVLAVSDNATMQHGIEARMPYLYDDVFRYANSISTKEKLKRKGKGPLKEILSKYNGLKYAKRAKQGFGLPLADWLRNKKSFWLWEFLLQESPIFEYVPKLQIYNLLGLHQRGKMDNSMQLWSILVLENWLSRYYK